MTIKYKLTDINSNLIIYRVNAGDVFCVSSNITNISMDNMIDKIKFSYCAAFIPKVNASFLPRLNLLSSAIFVNFNLGSFSLN